MKLLERFRATPEWQSDDPLVRAAAVRDLPDGEGARELLLEIARTDAHPVVRCQAIARIDDVDTLVSILSVDGDPDVRLEAAAGIRDLVIEATDPAVAMRGVEALADERDLAAVAREASLDEVSRLALSRVTSPHALSLVARRATRSDMAREALARVDEPDELQAVAVKADDKTIALTAFERLLSHDVTRETLEQVAKRARQKAVQRRARAALTSPGDADPTTDEAVETSHTDLCAEIERIATETDLDRGRGALERAIERWSNLEANPDEEVAHRFATGRRTAEARLVALEGEVVERLKQESREHGAVEQREALCRRFEQLPGYAPDSERDAIETEWASLPERPDPSDRVDRPQTSDGQKRLDLQQAFVSARTRFEHARAGFDERRRRAEAARQVLRDLEAGIEELQQLIDAGSLAGRVWSPVARRVGTLAADVPDDPAVLDPAARARMTELGERRQELEAKRRELGEAARAKRDQEERENLERMTQRVKALDGLVRSEKLTLAEAERQLRAARRLHDDPGPLPARGREAIARQLKQIQVGLLGRVRELRDFSDWQRWANLGIQEQLCGRMEALASVPEEDDEQFLTRYREIMAAWRQAADVPKERGADLWERFKLAHDAVQARYDRCRADEAERRVANAERQRIIVEEAERLASSTDWLNTVRRITELQAEWKAIGPSPRREQRALWNRFRAACNTFFGRRKADLATRKQEWARNLELKEALCARVEQLAEVEDLGAATADVKRAQAEWKAIGPVRRNRADALWQRFRAACDGIFERAHAGDREAAAERAKVREALCAELEGLVGDAAPDADADLGDAVRDLQKRWREAPDAPPPAGRKLSARFAKALASVVEGRPEAFRDSELDPSRTVKRLEKLCERVEALRPSAADITTTLSPAELLASKWRDALASNLMGARVDDAAEKRAAADQVRRAKQDYRRLGALVSVTGDSGRELSARFHAACDSVLRWAEPPRRASKSRSTPSQSPHAGDATSSSTP